eukprot:JP437256.1.p1 GENE.JP437256.1~~JP437256.1.p1  ORF type:complete len:166 (-),score=47.13 JP437256.1:114-611(-)
MTHGFDNVGRRFDVDLKLRNWWSDAVVANYKSRASCLADQYSRYTVSGTHVDGDLTLTENIADTGGLKLAYMAFLDKLYDDQQLNFTAPTQDVVANAWLFFIAYAQKSCSVERAQAEQVDLITSVHSPDKWRVNGPLMQSDDFSTVFQCPPGSPMNPTAKKCDLW